MKMVARNSNIKKKDQSKKNWRIGREDNSIIADFSHDWETWIQPDGIVKWINSAVKNVTGYAKEDFYELSMIDVIKKMTIPQDRQKVLTIFKKGFVEKTGCHDLNFQIQKKDGQYGWISLLLKPIQDLKGKYLGMHCSIRDITAAKSEARENCKSEQQILESQKLEAIGMLTSGIAHDFNNILTSIITFAQLIKMNHSEDRGTQNNTKEIINAVSRSKDLIRHVLITGDENNHFKKPIILETILGDVLKIIKPSIPAQIQIKQQIHSQKSIVFADPTQMHQVLMNLFTNAAQAMTEQGGVLKIELDVVTLPEDLCLSANDLLPGKYVNLIINDTGPGIKKKNLDRIFHPYFSTKKGIRGTGLGLSVSQKIIKDHHGAIIVDSVHGKGSRFSILIPHCEMKIQPKKEKIKEVYSHGDGVVLFVDDEAVIVKGVKQILNSIGYKTISASNGEKALAQFKENSNKIDIVLTDLTMPGMNGYELASKVKKIKPDIPVVLCTGLVEKVDKNKSYKQMFDAFLYKPYDRRGLLNLINQTLTKNTI